MAGNDSYTKLLLHCDGADTSTDFPDASPSNHTVTAQGDAQVDTAQQEFGTGSAVFDGSDSLTVSDSADWNFASGNFTIDMWVRFRTHTLDAAFVGQRTDGNNCYSLHWETSNELAFRQYGAGNTFIISKAWSPANDTWYHVALVRSGDNWYMFIDGIQIGTTTVQAGIMGDFTGDLQIGQGAWTLSHYLNGWIDELRISKGIARWVSDFTPPTAPYTTSGGLAFQAIMF